MASNIFETCNKKRKTNPKIPFPFEKFPDNGSIKDLNYGPFRVKILLFLQEFAEKIENDELPGMASWSTLLINERNGAVFPFYTIEETVEQSLNPFCDHCKFTGWGHHFVSRRKYHLIIPEIDQCKKPLKDDFFNTRTHVLYGLIHCNGYGHLICINRAKDESNFLRESDVMNFWDRICTTLCTRKISVRDEMDLRLLYVLAHGQTWYGTWGYKFSRGSFGVGKERYENAVEYLRSLGLEKIESDFENKGEGRKIKQIINMYRGVSDIPLITMSELLEFMLGFGGRGQIQGKTENKLIKSGRQHALKTRENEVPISFDALVTSIAKNSCRWSARRVELVLKEIVKLLKENKGKSTGNYGVSRYEMRGDLRKCIGDTGLIDFVLKSITCFAMGNCIIRRSVNSSTRQLEFKIHEVFLEGEPNCINDEERVGHTSEVSAHVLKQNHGKEDIVSWKEFQDKAKECIGDTELTDILINSRDNAIIRNQRVSRPKSPSTERIEFTIQDNVKDETTVGNLERNVDGDALYLCRNVLFGYSHTDAVTLATRDVLDSKHFVKEFFPEEQDINQIIALSCLVLPSFDEIETHLARPLSPAVVVVVPPSITIGELRAVAQSALRNTYCIMENFVVRQIGGLKKIEDDKVVCRSIVPKDPVWVRGSGLKLGTNLKYEDGVQRLTVTCSCGTKYDDGERLVTCELCHVSQHTRCNGFADDEDAPSHFVCSNCEAVLVKK